MLLAFVVLKNEHPPAKVSYGCSVVYVIRDANGWTYVGETESIANRLKSHRQKYGSDIDHEGSPPSLLRCNQQPEQSKLPLFASSEAKVCR